jgi:transposase-like protein
MGRKRTYAPAEKERARVALDVHGGNLSAAAREAGVPRATLQEWRDEWEAAALVPVPVEYLPAAAEYIRQDEKGKVIEAAWKAARVAFERIPELIPDAKDVQKVATAAAIAVDKAQLLSGGATARNEVDVRALLDTLPADVRAAVVALAADDGDA